MIGTQRARSGWEEFREFIRQFTPEKMATVCGVDREVIRKAARTLCDQRNRRCAFTASA